MGGIMSIPVTWVMAIGADPAYPLAKGHNGHDGLSHAAAGFWRAGDTD